MFSYAYYMKDKICIGTYYTNTKNNTFPSINDIKKELNMDLTIVSIYEFKNSNDYISAQK